MTINDYRKGDTRPLSNLIPGAVFIYGNHYYLVTTEIHNNYITTVNLEAGEIRCLNKESRVKYISNASVSIRD